MKGLHFSHSITRLITISMSVIIGGLVLLSACQSKITALSDEMQSNVRLTDESEVYEFTGNPTQPTILKFNAGGVKLPFYAEVRDSAGVVVAALRGDTLQNAALTIGPGEGMYEVVMQTDNSLAEGKVYLSLSYPEVPQAEATPQAHLTTYGTAADYQPDCRMTVLSEQGIVVYSEPGMAASTLGVLPMNSQYPATARTHDGWYRLSSGNQRGWVQANTGIVQMNGLCSRLPVLQTVAAPTTLPALGGSTETISYAPYDVEIHFFSVNLVSGGEFANAISYPDGDSSDLIHVSVSQPDVNTPYTFALAMNCTGSGAGALRWGLVNTPNLTCADSLTLPETVNTTELELLVALPGNSAPSYAAYTLRAVPVAPADEPVTAFGVDRDAGGAYSGIVSYPAGDVTDTVQVVVVNLEPTPPNNYRDFHITLQCEGTGVENIRWGMTQNTTLPCNSTLRAGMLDTANVQTLAITVPPDSGQTYVRYHIWVVPVAPLDQQDFIFGIDRDSGGQFNEAVSYPAGDKLDTLEVNVANLLAGAPNNYREFTLYMVCDGRGVEYVRWGLPQSPTMQCNEGVRMPFIYGDSPIQLVVTLPEGIPQSYISYALVAAGG